MNIGGVSKLSKERLIQELRKIMKSERDLKRDATEAQEDFKLRRRDELGKIENRILSKNT